MKYGKFEESAEIAVGANRMLKMNEVHLTQSQQSRQHDVADQKRQAVIVRCCLKSKEIL